LTEAQRVFIGRFLIHHCATRAYREAFPEAMPSTAASEGSRLKSDPRIAQEIKRALAELTARYRRTAENTLATIALIAFANIVDAFDENGALIAPENIPREVGAAIKKIERVEISGRDADGNPTVTGHTVNIELWDKLAALRMLGQHYGLFVERVEVTPGRDFASVLREARERVIAAREGAEGSTVVLSSLRPLVVVGRRHVAGRSRTDSGQ
jgi:phage terminase small subunit